jgi:hypothetical protein
LPKGWKQTDAIARMLTGQGTQVANATINGNIVTIQIPARQPIILYRDAAKAT